MTLKNKGLIKMILFGAAAIAVGILINNHTDALIQIVMIAAGIGACVDGFYTLAGMKKWKFSDTTKTLATIKGYESMVLGIAAILIAIFAADTAITVMVYIFAIGLLFSAVVAFQNATVAGKFEIDEMRSHFFVEGIFELLVALLLFCKPVDTVYTIVKILAIGLMVIGAIMVIVPVAVMFKGKKEGETEAVVGEAEVVEDETKTE